MGIIKNWLRKWWDGEYVEIKDDPGSIVVTHGYTNRHWTARFSRWFIKGLRNDWKFWLKFLLGACALIVSIFGLLKVFPK